MPVIVVHFCNSFKNDTIYPCFSVSRDECINIKYVKILINKQIDTSVYPFYGQGQSHRVLKPCFHLTLPIKTDEGIEQHLGSNCNL